METGLVKTDDVLFMRFLLLGALALEVSKFESFRPNLKVHKSLPNPTPI